MTLDDLKREAVLVIEKFPCDIADDQERNRNKESREKRFAELGHAYCGKFENTPAWNFRVDQSVAFFDGDWRWRMLDETDWVDEKLRKAEAVSFADVKKRWEERWSSKLAKPAQALEPIVTERGIFHLALPINPISGKQNVEPLNLGALCMLSCLVDQVMKNPKYADIIKTFAQKEPVDFAPLTFQLDTGELRKMTGMDWPNEKQLADFKELAHWRAAERYIFEKERHDKRGHWKTIERTQAWPFMGPSRIDKRRRAGAPDKVGEQVNFRFEGRLDEATSVILLFDLAQHQTYKIAAPLGNLDENEKKLYFQGLPFIKKGWLVKYGFACKVLWGEVKAQTGPYGQGIRKTVEGLKRVGWKRDKKTEADLRQKGVIGRGQNLGWFLRISAPSKSLHGKARRRLPPHSE